ncbi:Tn3 family transposase [Ensifer adhaerens]|uniref:Tn3 family transposase n=1 Tax=Rhizobium sp. 11_C7_N12_5 TaxID=3240770 RepID=UPI00156A1410
MAGGKAWCHRSDRHHRRKSSRNSTGSVIGHRNTVYLRRATAHLSPPCRNISNELLRHISPLCWEYINPTGIYSWDTDRRMP